MCDGFFVMGVIKLEIICKVVFLVVFLGIVGVVLLVVSCVIGEMMIVVMVVGCFGNLIINLFDSVMMIIV